MFLTDTNTTGDRLAILSQDGGKMTYNDLHIFSKKIGTNLKTRTLALVLCDSYIDTLSFYYALLDNRVVPVLIDENIDADLLKQLLDIYQPRFIWMQKKYLNENQEILCPNAYNIINEYGNHVFVELPYDTFPIADDLALLVETSGSTGSRKLVRLSYENLLDNVYSNAQFVNANVNDKFIVMMPYSHMLTLTWIHMHWYLGATVLLTNHTLLSTMFWDFFYEQKVTNFVGVPFVLDLLNKINFLDKEYSSLRYIVEAGGKITETLQKEFGKKLNEKGTKFYIAYGQTETTALVTMLPSELVTDKIGSIGIPMEGVKIEVEENSNEIIIEGKCICLGYAEKKSDLLLQGQGTIWRTGDIGRMDEDGCLYLTGRKKRFIKVMGNRINLDDIERLLNEKELFKNCACLGEDDLIYIFTEKSSIKVTDQIKEYLAKKIHVNKAFIKTIYIKELPRTNSGKIRYTSLIMEK